MGNLGFKREKIHVCVECKGDGCILNKPGGGEFCMHCRGSGIEPQGIKVTSHCKTFMDIIFQRAIDLWGEDAQIRMAIEECAELIVQLIKLDRRSNGSEYEDVVNEIADVEIMMAQLRIIFGDQEIDTAKRIKLDKLFKIIKEAEDVRN